MIVSFWFQNEEESKVESNGKIDESHSGDSSFRNMHSLYHYIKHLLELAHHFISLFNIFIELDSYLNLDLSDLSFSIYLYIILSFSNNAFMLGN